MTMKLLQIVVVVLSSVVLDVRGYIIVPHSPSQQNKNSSSLQSSYYDSFASMPAGFGEPWKDGVFVQARLQLPPMNRLKLCPNDDGNDNLAATDPSSRQLGAVRDNMEDDNNDFLPRALLVERGDCDFIEKAREAQKLHIDYVIIYDNIEEWSDDKALFLSGRRMGGPHWDGPAPLSVSYAAGQALKSLIYNNNINEKAPTTDPASANGLLVELHGLQLPRLEDSNKNDPEDSNKNDPALTFLLFVYGCIFLFCVISMLRVLRAAKPAFIHAAHVCDGCNCRPILGKRYRRFVGNVEDNYDLCETCYKEKQGKSDDDDDDDDEFYREVVLQRDALHQKSWRLYRLLTGLEPLPGAECSTIKTMNEEKLGNGHSKLDCGGSDGDDCTPDDRNDETPDVDGSIVRAQRGGGYMELAQVV